MPSAQHVCLYANGVPSLLQLDVQGTRKAVAKVLCLQRSKVQHLTMCVDTEVRDQLMAPE